MTLKEVYWRVKAIDKRLNSKFKIDLALHDKTLKNQPEKNLPSFDKKQKELLESKMNERLKGLSNGQRN